MCELICVECGHFLGGQFLRKLRRGQLLSIPKERSEPKQEGPVGARVIGVYKDYAITTAGMIRCQDIVQGSQTSFYPYGEDDDTSPNSEFVFWPGVRESLQKKGIVIDERA